MTVYDITFPWQGIFAFLLYSATVLDISLQSSLYFLVSMLSIIKSTMPRESKKKRKSCESLIKAREALKKLKESANQEVTVESSPVLDQQARES